MKTGGGDFSAEAYQQMREAYSNEQQKAVDDELKGTQLMGQEYGLETLPVDSPWKGKIENWEYPSGKGQYIDEHQSPDDILKIMREAAEERIAERKEEEEESEEVSDEEFDKAVDEILSEDDEETEEDESESETEEEEDDDDDKTEDEDESEVAETEDEPEAEVEPDADMDPEDIAAQIAELRAEIEGLSFITEEQVEESADDE